MYKCNKCRKKVRGEGFYCNPCKQKEIKMIKQKEKVNQKRRLESEIRKFEGYLNQAEEHIRKWQKINSPYQYKDFGCVNDGIKR